MTNHAPANPLDKILQKQEEELSRVISKGNRWYRWTDPELLRVLGRVSGRLGEVRRYRLLRRGDDEAKESKLDERLADLLSRRDLHDTARSVSNAWDYERELQLTLYDIVDDGYVKAQLMGEAAIQHSSAEAPYGPWSKHLAKEELGKLLKKYDGTPTKDDRQLAVECLTYLYNARHESGRYNVLNIRLKTRYLYGLMMMMATLLVVLLYVIYFISHEVSSISLNPWTLLRTLFERGVIITHPDFKHAVLAAATGALGSVMSGFYKLRDKGKYLSDLRSFRSAMLAQPFVGACIGLLLFLILKSHILGVSSAANGGEWAAYSIFGFLGGFSEPFFLGIVESVARKGERDARVARGNDEDGRDDGAGADASGKKDTPE